MFANIKWFHYVYIALGGAIVVLTWVLAQNTAGTFTLTAQVIAGLTTALTMFKTVQGLLQPSTSSSSAAKGDAAKLAGGVLLMGILGAMIFGSWKTNRIVVGQAMQDDGRMAFVGMPAQGCSSGTVTPQTQADIVAAEQLGQCIENTYASDSQKTPAMQPLQIALDISMTCGADVVDLVSTLGQSTVSAGEQAVAAAAQSNASAVHTNALVHKKASR